MTAAHLIFVCRGGCVFFNVLFLVSVFSLLNLLHEGLHVAEDIGDGNLGPH